MSEKFEVFISYRRKGGYNTAKLIYDRLKLDGYSVSFDIDTLEKGDFDKELESRVKECKDFLVILNPGIFDRFYNPDADPKDDWVRREMACALAENKNIVPLFLDGFEWPKNALPPDVKDITRKNGIDLNPKYFEAAYENLKRRFLNSQPRWTVKHKKKIFTGLSLAVLVIAAFLYFAITKEIDSLTKEIQIRDSLEIQARDSLAKEIQTRDSARQDRQEQRRLDSIKWDSLTQFARTQKVTGKPLHWIGSSGSVEAVLFEKLIPAGIQITKCSGDGININTTSPNCKSSNDKATCSYPSPQLILTDCNGKSLGVLDIGTNFLTEPQINVATARRELAHELHKADFSKVISEIEGYK
jgi:hypothetical protein